MISCSASLLIIITIIIIFAGVGFGHMIRLRGEFLLRSPCRVCLEKLEATRPDGEGSFVTLFFAFRSAAALFTCLASLVLRPGGVSGGRERGGVRVSSV